MHRILAKIVVLLALSGGYSWYLTQAEINSRASRQAVAMQQLNDSGDTAAQIDLAHAQRNSLHFLGWAILGLVSVAIFGPELKAAVAIMLRRNAPTGTTIAALALLLGCTGCWRPFEPIQLETINPNEEAFLLPYRGDTTQQTSTNNEEYLRSNLVYTKQVKIPQQWVPKGYETFGPNGNWKPDAVLVKVDKSPVTREWTADPNSGTSNRNEAIWVMTSDQVEFSTGWTCTARIASRDDAVKFLHNYPNGSLQIVMDTELRAKLQAIFGLEVTDVPMDTLRKQATPHITKVTKEVSLFFEERGITITNLGISGGFVYKDKSIMDTMVKVFNAEQEKSIAQAAFQAQEMKNKTIQSEAEGKAKAIITQKQAEADGVKLVADANLYEIEQAKADSQLYLTLKRFELEREKLLKWDGRFPTYFLGSGESHPDMLLQLPTIPTAKQNAN